MRQEDHAHWLWWHRKQQLLAAVKSVKRADVRSGLVSGAIAGSLVMLAVGAPRDESGGSSRVDWAWWARAVPCVTLGALVATTARVDTWVARAREWVVRQREMAEMAEMTERTEKSVAVARDEHPNEVGHLRVLS